MSITGSGGAKITGNGNISFTRTTIDATPQLAFSTAGANTLDVTSYTGSNTYQNGRYIASASSSAGANYPYNAFDGSLNTIWHCAYTGINGYSQQPYVLATGLYQGGGSSYVYATAVNGVGSIAGEWLQIQLPYQLQLTTYSLYPPQITFTWLTRSPKIFYVVGSNDGVTWFQVDYQNLTSFPNDYKPLTYNATTNTNAYSYFRIIINTVYITNSDDVVHLSEWKLKGFYKGSSTSNA